MGKPFRRRVVGASDFSTWLSEYFISCAKNGTTPDLDTIQSKYSELVSNTNHNYAGDGSSIPSSDDPVGFQGFYKTGAGKLSDTEKKDWNQYVEQQELQFAIEQEKRQYNEGLLQNQRQYDLPSNVLSRLLATGMSRDAAFALLSGASGGSGASMPYSANAALGQPIAPSQSSLNAIQGVTSILDTFTSLIGLGLSAPSALMQARVLSATATASENVLTGAQLAGTAYDIITTSGADVPAETFNSVDKAASFIHGLADAGNAAAAAFVKSGGADKMRSLSPYCSPALADLYKSERSGDDYDTSYSATIDNLRAETAVKNVTSKSLAVGIQKAEKEMVNIAADTKVKEEQVRLMTVQADLLRKQGKVAEAEELLVKAQAKAQDFANQYTEAVYQGVDEDTGLTGLDLLSGAAIERASADFQKLAMCNDNRLWETQALSMMAESENLLAYNIFRHWYYSSAYSVATDPEYEGLYSACAAMDECGFFDYMDAIVNASNFSVSVGQNGSSVHGVIDREALVQQMSDMSDRRISNKRRSSAVRRLFDYITLDKDEYNKKYPSSKYHTY